MAIQKEDAKKPMMQPDWMDPGWLHAQRMRLEKERNALREEIESAAEQLGTTGTADPREPGDMAEEDREDTEVAAAIAVLQPRLEDIEEALRQIAAGDYGRCASCRGWIPSERLSAMPSARRCIRCQESFERRAERLRSLNK
jgi:RNA polymerase-binding transcription factor